MKRRKLSELYGSRFSPWSNVIGVLLIIAFGIFLALTKSHQEKASEQKPQTEQSE